MFKKINSKIRLASAGLTVAGMSSLMPIAYANNTTTLNVTEQPITGANDIMGTIIGYIASIFRYIGILLMVWSIGMLVLAFKNEDADSKSRAMMMLVVSLILITLKSIVNAILKAANTGINLV